MDELVLLMVACILLELFTVDRWNVLNLLSQHMIKFVQFMVKLKF